MKKLSLKELDEAPRIIQYLQLVSVFNIPIGLTLYEEAIREYPQYFPDEIAYRNKWNSIPQEVHDAFSREEIELNKEIYKDVPHKGKGILFYSQNYKEAEEHREAWRLADEKAIPLRKKLHDKYYSKYGIEWMGF